MSRLIDIIRWVNNYWHAVVLISERHLVVGEAEDAGITWRDAVAVAAQIVDHGLGEKAKKGTDLFIAQHYSARAVPPKTCGILLEKRHQRENKSVHFFH